MDNNKLDELAKLIRDGADDEELSQFIKKGESNLETAINGSRSFEKSLGRQYLKQTGVPIPDYKNASNDQLEKFSRDLLAEQNPEIKKTNVKINNDIKDYGLYYPKSNVAEVSKVHNKDIEEYVGTLLHEGGHSYDSKKGLYTANPSVDIESFDPAKKAQLKSMGIKRGGDLAKQEASIINEIIQAGHHADIPNVRQGTFGRANLANIMKGKAVRAVPFIGPAIGAAAALATGDVSAAIPVVNEMDALGPAKGSIEDNIEKGNASPEEMDQLYKNLEPRRKALQQLTQRRIENGQ